MRGVKVLELKKHLEERDACLGYAIAFPQSAKLWNWYHFKSRQNSPLFQSLILPLSSWRVLHCRYLARFKIAD